MSDLNNAGHDGTSDVNQNVDVSQGWPVAEGNQDRNVDTDDNRSQDFIEKAPDSLYNSKTSNDSTSAMSGEDAAVIERLRRQQARSARLLSTLGIDPMSDVAEQLENGIITEDMLRQHVTQKFAPQQPYQAQNQVSNQASTPVSIAQENLTKIKDLYNEEASQGGVSLETNNQYLEAIQALQDAKLDNLTQQMTAQRAEEQVSKNVEAVLNVARSSDGYSNMDQGTQDALNKIYISTTGQIADEESRRLGLDARNLGPQHYGYFASLAQQRLDGLLGFYRNQSGRPQPKFNNNNMPVPASGSGQGPAPLPNPFKSVTLKDHRDAAREFLAGTGRV